MPHTTDPEGVPLSVWLPATNHSCGHAARRRLAADAVNAYTTVGGVVIDLLPGREAVAAARVAGRSAMAIPVAPPCDGRRRLAALAVVEGTADLVLALPSAMALATTRSRPFPSLAGRLLAARAATLLAPGGYLAVGVAGAQAAGADPITDAVATVTAQGFIYFQHVVALLRADLDHDRPAVADGRDVFHVDLLVFERRPA